MLVKRGAKRAIPRLAQRGATLIIGLIMIVLITLIVLSAFTLSSSNLKSVRNMQMHDESLAAANQAVERLISMSFTDAPGTVTFNVDINKDGTNNYAVTVGTPSCINARAATVVAPSDVELGPGMSAGETWNTDWDIDANVTDVASGAAVRVRQGVRVLLSTAEKNAVCP
jgi:hypothetical protein